jgi:23S rRNA (uracil1939-C5)-methyltransferase
LNAPRPGDAAHVTCVDLDDDGAAISASSADTVRLHVAGALPGERVAATVEHVSPHAREAWGRLDEIEAPSPARRPPACRAFGACGGCVLQHLAYESQLDWKSGRVRAALAAHPALADVPVQPTVASPRTLGYRNRSKLVPARVGGRFVLGAYAPRSHQVVDLSGCAIAEPPLDDIATASAELFDRAGITPYDEHSLTGDLRHVVLQRNHVGDVLAVWVTRRPLTNGPALARELRAERSEVIGVVEHFNPRRGNAIFDPAAPSTLLDGAAALDEVLEVAGRPVHLRLSAGAFFQANRAVAALAYAAITEGLAPRPGERLVDAYCGVGGIALTLARSADEVIGIEFHGGAVEDARAAALRAGLQNVELRAGDAAAQLATIPRGDLIVLNPPRKGCAPDVLAQITRLAPRALAYLSCNPDTLARDLAVLVDRGYRITRITPFDMLPHTPHIEALALLERTA